MSSTRKLRRFAKRRNALSADVSNLVAMQEIRQERQRELMRPVLTRLYPDGRKELVK